MARVARDPADVIDAIDDGVERHAGIFRRRRAADSAGHQHPGVVGGANHRVSGDQLPDLVVGDWRLCATSDRQFEWLAQTGPWK